MRRHFLMPAVVFAALFLVRPVPAQKFQPKTIQFKGDPEYTDQELLDAAGLKKDAVLSLPEMNAAAKKLLDSGVFDQLAYKFDGADLVFTMSPATELYPVRIDNLPLPVDLDLDAEMHRRFPLYHGKVPAEAGLTDQVREALEEILATEGVKATVTAAPYGNPLHRSIVTAVSFSIVSQPVRLRVVQVAGASAAMLPQVQLVATRSAQAAFDFGISASDLREQIASLYRDNGYAAAKVEATRSGAPVQSADSIEVPYVITIQEGRVYKTGWVHVPAGALLTQEEADDQLAAHAGQGPTAGVGLLMAVIQTRYKARGYLDVVITPHPEFDEAADTANYTLDIAPGAVYHLAYVKFDNVSDDLRARLMHAWEMMPGDAFNQTYLDTFVIKSEQQDQVLRRALGGGLARIETSADPSTHDVNVVIRFDK